MDKPWHEIRNDSFRESPPPLPIYCDCRIGHHSFEKDAAGNDVRHIRCDECNQIVVDPNDRWNTTALPHHSKPPAPEVTP